MVKILLADNHAIIRDGLKIIIRNYLVHAIVDDASDGTSVLEKVTNDDYQLIILDVSMRGTDSADLVTNILALRPEARILMFSMFNEEIYAKRYLQLGVMGYLNKASPENEIKKAIENVLNNKKYVSAALLETLTQHTFPEKFSNPFIRLSKREMEILQQLLKGKGVTGISGELDIDSSTVGTYKMRIFKKLNCKNMMEINSLAGLYNFIPPFEV
ncbi:MAG: two component transcriptional regulator, LuxR family [Chitinophagaceae bacterium]|nr:two component transcriptional regulator, LuxR family [Chitinophagaceae bacterium]